MIEITNLTKSYGEKKVLADLNLTIHCDEFFVIVGTSGSGKTTTLKMLNRLIEPTEGEILFNGKNIKDFDLRSLRLEMGYVLQKIALFPNLTVRENIELIPEMKGWSKQKRLEKCKILLEKVGLNPDTYLNRFPKELSGGEQQRVGILRAIITEPKILLMDEPFSALDPISRRELQKLIKELHDELKINIIFVTHDMQEAMFLADRIAIMSKGKLIQVDTPNNIKEKPANKFVEEFFKSVEGDCHG
ncbi:ABC transporter ATP-binding protein [Streptobacillus canis]|uniref:ABC transporter ATP-binding protein n=1 Tax=Streptobacillus canis TaxID=2678686 RepID=UPI0012E307F2|nr:ABC transporter ATP-binding protein [Streptobacillus canis]